MRVIALVLAAACSSSSTPPSVKTGSAAPAGSGSGSAATASADHRKQREAVLGLNAHIIVLKTQATFAEYPDVLHTVEQNPDVVAAEPFLFAEVVGTAPGGSAPAMALKGVDPARVGKVLTLEKMMIEGTTAALGESRDPPAILVGRGLARTLGVKVGDSIQVALPPGDPATKTTRRMFRVAGMFYSGMDEYDTRLAFTSLAAMQPLFNKGDQVMGVEAVVKDLMHSDATAKAIERALGGPPFQVMDWFELNRAFFKTRE